MPSDEKPNKTVRYVIIDANGDVISGRRQRESGAWANAAFKRGVLDYEEQQEEIEKLKDAGCRAELREGVYGRPKLTSEEDAVGGEEFLHMRLSAKDKMKLEKLTEAYSTGASKPTRSWIVRKLISEKVNRLGIKA